MAPYSPRLARRIAEVVRALWFLPVLMALGGVVLGIAMPRVDAIPHVLAALRVGWVQTVMDSAPAGAQQVLAASAGALATVLGVAFSLTLVTLQLATAQYTPRLIGRLLEDRVTKLVLGGYIGTVAYLLLVLRSVHGVGDGEERFVPRLSMALGLVLILGCLGLLAYFVDHLGSSIQAASLAAGVGRRTMRRLEELRDSGGEPVSSECTPRSGPGLARSDGQGYVQLVDVTRLASALPRGVTTAQLLVAAGDFVLPEQPIVAFWPARALQPRQATRLVRAVALGDQRTEDQDVLYGVRLLADMGLKALSPGINDETTAITAVNHLASVVAVALRWGEGVPWQRYRACGRTVIAPGLTLRRIVEDGFGGLVRFSVDHPRVLARIVEVIRELVTRMQPCDGRDALLEVAAWVEHALATAGLAPHERQLVVVRLDALRGENARDRVDGPHAMH